MTEEKTFEINTAVSPSESLPDSAFGTVIVDAKMKLRYSQQAAIFLLKMTFAAGVLSIPSALYSLGAVAVAIFILFWGVLNTYMAYIQRQYKMTHPSVHTVADAAYIATLDLSNWSKKTAFIIRELTDILYIITWILCAGVSTLGLSVALNAVSKHATCSVVFGFVAYIVIASVASVRKIQHLGWVTWVGFGSMVTAILIVVIDFFKSVYVCMTWITTSYLTLALTVYAYSGKWVASPALGSAGPTIKIIAYAIATPRLIAGAMIYVHVAAKSLFVRALRGTHHLTENTKTHWAVWLTCTYGVGLAGWILAEAIPFFSSLVSLIGALGFGPLGICLPAVLWFSLHKDLDKSTWAGRSAWLANHFLFLVGLLVTVGGTYVIFVNINNLFNAGEVGSAFQCADNSGTVASS
ncbi:hypothetical protein LTR36_002962 [Oleoguttula mirabilis]|uniref:Amino acid transporter transmembrane domain-containing protein n=1 Tax=Oleoguttula mirabilis TaxID=1507867 RepID=A0AAV9JW63_9PEZI|nr:hypothetical protein LTR36_002962 [Oleoguttula mirabilis]